MDPEIAVFDSEIPVLTGRDVLPVAMGVPTAPPENAFYEEAPPESAPAMMMPRQQQETSAKLPETARQGLAAQGFTAGLIEALENNCKRAFTNSIWIVDNSGSMQTQDGKRIVLTTSSTGHHHHDNHHHKSAFGGSSDGTYKFVPCTRWAEMQQTVDYHAQLAALLEFPTTFRLLNDPGRMVGPAVFTVTSSYDLATAQSTMEQCQAAGVTPLSYHLREIAATVRSMADSLRQNGQRVTVTLATDGTPTDERGQSDELCQQYFMAAMRELEGLPIWIVVRLCTDNDKTVEFWNGLDQDLEVPLEVLDDFVAEATEVHEHNPWLNYGLPLHRMREMGFYHTVFDHIDERPLHKTELIEFMKIIFGRQKLAGIPDPDADWKGFAARIATLNVAESKTYDPIHQKVLPWIDMHKLDHVYGSRKWFGLL